MTTNVQAHITKAHTKAQQSWFYQGWELFKKAPFSLFLFMIIPMVLAGLMQLLPAPYSIVLSKFCAWLLAAMVWPVMHHLDQHNKVSVTAIFAAPGWSKMPLMALCGLTVFAFEVLVAFLLLGSQGIELTLWGKINNVAPWQLGVIFATSAPIAVALSLATACCLLCSTPVFAAIKRSLKVCLNANKALALLIVINALALFIAPFTFALGSLLLAPWLTCVGYYAYRSMFTTNG